MRRGPSGKTAKDVLFGLVGHIAGRGAPILAGIVISQGLGTAEFAAFSFLTLTALTFATLSVLGMAVVATRYFAVLDESPGKGSHLLTAVCIGLCGASIGSVLLYVLPEIVGAHTAGVHPLLLSSAAFALAFNLLTTSSLSGLGRFDYVAAASAVSGMVTVLGAFVAVAYSDVSIAMWFLIASQLSHVVGARFAWGRIRASGAQVSLAFNPRTLWATVEYSGIIFLTNILSTLGLWLPGRLLLATEGGVDYFATYAVALQLFSLVLVTPTVINTIYHPRIFRHFWTLAKGGHTKNPTLTGTALGVAAALPVALGLIIFPRQILTLWSASWATEGEYLVAVAAMGLLAASVNTLGYAISAKASQGIWLKLTALWFTIIAVSSIQLREHGVLVVLWTIDLAYLALIGASAVVGRRLRAF